MVMGAPFKVAASFEYYIGMRKALVAVLLLIIAMAQVPDERPEVDPYNASGDAPAGPPIAGLAVSLMPYRSVYRLGSPIWVVAELRNLSGQGVQLGSLFMENYELSVIDLATGRAVPLYPNWQMQLSAFTSLGGVAMPAKWSHYAGLRLDRLAQINRPGSYSVQATVTCGLWLDDGSVQLPSSTKFQSNVITIRVVPPGYPIPASPQWSSGRPASSSHATPAGPTSDDFALAVTPQQSKIELGAPIDVNVELRDVSGVMHSVLFGSPHRDYEYTIVDRATGSVVAGVPPAPSHLESPAVPWDSRLVFGESSLYGNLELRPSYKFAAGTYTLRITGHPVINGKRVALESNPIEITLVPPATPVPQITLAESQKVMSVRVETDRSVYAAGEPVRVRFVVTNLIGSPLYYDGTCSPFVLSVLSDGAIRTSNSRPCIMVRMMGLYRIPLGTTKMGWGYPYPYDDEAWPKLDLWGFHLSDLGDYAITVRGELKGTSSTPRGDFTFSSANVVGSPGVTIRILTRELARAEPGEKLGDASLNVAFGSLVREYVRLSSPLHDIIVQIAMGVNHSQLSARLGDQWGKGEHDLLDRVGRLPSAGNPTSPYHEVNANLEQAAYELGAAEDHALNACDARAATADLKVADYFIRAVKSELRSGIARPGDAADAPPAATGWGYCK
jgi:hypothetical protein